MKFNSRSACSISIHRRPKPMACAIWKAAAATASPSFFTETAMAGFANLKYSLRSMPARRARRYRPHPDSPRRKLVRVAPRRTNPSRDPPRQSLFPRCGRRAGGAWRVSERAAGAQSARCVRTHRKRHGLAARARRRHPGERYVRPRRDGGDPVERPLARTAKPARASVAVH